MSFRAIEFVREVEKGGRKLRYATPRIIADSAGAQALARYFEPWTIAACDETGRRASETVLAAVYMALEAKRISQGSKGFLALADAELGEPCCRECGQVASRRVDVTPWDRDEPKAERIPNWGPKRERVIPATPESTVRILDAKAFSALLRDASEDIRTRGWRKPRDPWRETRPPS